MTSITDQRKNIGSEQGQDARVEPSLLESKLDGNKTTLGIQTGFYFQLDDTNKESRYYQVVFDKKIDPEEIQISTAQQIFTDKRTITSAESDFKESCGQTTLEICDAYVEKVSSKKPRLFNRKDYLLHIKVEGTARDFYLFEKFMNSKNGNITAITSAEKFPRVYTYSFKHSWDYSVNADAAATNIRAALKPYGTKILSQSVVSTSVGNLFGTVVVDNPKTLEEIKRVVKNAL